MTVAPGHQLLVEQRLRASPTALELPSFALGYNVVCSEVFELLSEVSVALVPGRRPELGLVFGFVATLPDTSRRARRRGRG